MTILHLSHVQLSLTFGNSNTNNNIIHGTSSDVTTVNFIILLMFCQILCAFSCYIIIFMQDDMGGAPYLHCMSHDHCVSSVHSHFLAAGVYQSGCGRDPVLYYECDRLMVDYNKIEIFSYQWQHYIVSIVPRSLSYLISIL